MARNCRSPCKNIFFVSSTILWKTFKSSSLDCKDSSRASFKASLFSSCILSLVDGKKQFALKKKNWNHPKPHARFFKRLFQEESTRVSLNTPKISCSFSLRDQKLAKTWTLNPRINGKYTRIPIDKGYPVGTRYTSHLFTMGGRPFVQQER